MYAVIRTGGKQYRVEAGQQLRTERLPGNEGDTVELTEVLMIGGDDGVTIGTPMVSDARVVAEIVSQGRHKPVTVFKYKNKIRYRRLHRHRQLQTTLTIQEILPPGASATAADRGGAAAAAESSPKDTPTDATLEGDEVATPAGAGDGDAAPEE